jgi:hypothetical protein
MPIRATRVTDLLVSYIGKYWPIIVLVAFAGMLHCRLLEGPFLAKGDHQIHIFKAWLLNERLIPSGRLIGWTNMAYAGYPEGMYYSIGGYLYLGLVKLLTLGLADWHRVYGIGIFGVMLALPLSVYAATRQVTGKYGAFVAGLLMIGDLGGFRQGGAMHSLRWGVWPFVLSVALFMLALSLLPKALTTVSRDKRGLALLLAITTACCVLTHQFAGVVIGVVFPVVIIALAVATFDLGSALSVFGRASLVFMLAFGLALFWILPQMMEIAHSPFPFTAKWHSLDTMAGRLLSNELFDNFSWIAWALSGLGLVIALAFGRAFAKGLALAAIALFLVTGLSRELPSQWSQAERFVAFEKALCFVLAGIAVDWLGGVVQKALPIITAKLAILGKPTMQKLLPIACGVLVATTIVSVDWSKQYSRVARITVLSKAEKRNFIDANTWIADHSTGQLDRVLYAPGVPCFDGNPRRRACRRAYNTHLWNSGPLWSGQPRVRFGFEPTAVGQYLPLSHRWRRDARLIQKLFNSHRALEQLNVRWIVSSGEWKQAAHLTKKARFGEIHVLAVAGHAEPPVKLHGEGALNLVRFSDEEVIIDLKGTGAKSTVRYPIAYHPWWRATHQGDGLEISLIPLHGSKRELLMSVAARDGRTTLRFTRPRYARVASLISLFCWCGCLFWIVAQWKRKTRC